MPCTNMGIQSNQPVHGIVVAKVAMIAQVILRWAMELVN